MAGIRDCAVWRVVGTPYFAAMRPRSRPSLVQQQGRHQRLTKPMSATLGQ